jgi:hypothetical protein
MKPIAFDVQERALNPGDDSGPLVEYRGQRFTVEAHRRGEVWIGQYRMLDAAPQQLQQAAAAGRHQWTSMDPCWGTPHEARRNATEAALAAIDALHR